MSQPLTVKIGHHCRVTAQWTAPTTKRSATLVTIPGGKTFEKKLQSIRLTMEIVDGEETATVTLVNNTTCV